MFPKKNCKKILHCRTHLHACILNIADVIEGDHSLLFSSPEAAVLPKWRKVIKEHLVQKISLLVFDEAHCISLW